MYKYEFSYDKKHLKIFKNRKHKQLIKILKQFKSTYRNVNNTFNYNQLQRDKHSFDQSENIANEQH